MGIHRFLVFVVFFPMPHWMVVNISGFIPTKTMVSGGVSYESIRTLPRITTHPIASPVTSGNQPWLEHRPLRFDDFPIKDLH